MRPRTAGRVVSLAEGDVPRIDVVIPTLNGWPLLERCLTCLRAQTVPHTAIVVDNGSSDGTGESVRTRFPEAKLVELESNRGFPAACNCGAAAGTGQIVVLLNNDVEPAPTFLAELVTSFADAGLGSAAGVLLRRDAATIDSVGVAVDVTLAGFPRLRGSPAGGAARDEPVLLGPAGGAAAYRRRAWDEVGGFDEGVLGYGEDVDLALRLRAAGWRTIAASSALAIHLGSASFGRRSAFQRYHGGFARGYFLRRYRVLRTTAALRVVATEAIVVVGDLLISRDLQALRGRLAGWRAASGLRPRSWPPPDCIDMSLSFWKSLRARVTIYRT
jgi:N-acetylglucosaminyl-diphospho-decaprenol L-rhamnosyltransferase